MNSASGATSQSKEPKDYSKPCSWPLHSGLASAGAVDQSGMSFVCSYASACATPWQGAEQDWNILVDSAASFWDLSRAIVPTLTRSRHELGPLLLPCCFVVKSSSLSGATGFGK